MLLCVYAALWCANEFLSHNLTIKKLLNTFCLGKKKRTRRWVRSQFPGTGSVKERN